MKDLLTSLRQTPEGLLSQLDPESDCMGNAFIDLRPLRRVPWFEEVVFLYDGQELPGKVYVECRWREDAERSGKGTISVRLVRGEGLRPKNKDGTSDPYVQLALGKLTHTSQTIMKTLNPTWDEEFEFKGKLRELTSKRLDVQVWDYNAFHDDFHEAPPRGRDTYHARNSFNNLFVWSNTALPRVAKSAELWVPCAVYVTMLVASIHSHHVRSFNPDFLSGGLYSLMIFALTFYTGSILSRYWAQWDCTQCSWGRIDDIDSVGAAYLANDVAAHEKITRICHAFQIVKVRRSRPQ